MPDEYKQDTQKPAPPALPVASARIFNWDDASKLRDKASSIGWQHGFQSKRGRVSLCLAPSVGR